MNERHNIDPNFFLTIDPGLAFNKFPAANGIGAITIDDVESALLAEQTGEPEAVETFGSAFDVVVVHTVLVVFTICAVVVVAVVEEEEEAEDAISLNSCTGTANLKKNENVCIIHFMAKRFKIKENYKTWWSKMCIKPNITTR